MRKTLIACVITALALGGGTATAASLFTGASVTDGSLTGADIKDGSLKKKDIKTGAVSESRLSKGVRNKLNEPSTTVSGSPGAAGAKGDTGAAGSKGDKGDKGPAGILGSLADSLAAPMAIAKIGGPINANNTDLHTGLTLPAGTYIVTVDAAFESSQAGDAAVEVYPQVSLWIDRDDNGAFTWQTGEGDISPNAIMPRAANRHISASGLTHVTLTEETYVGLVAHGYTSTQGSERSGQINVVRAVIGALPVATP